MPLSVLRLQFVVFRKASISLTCSADIADLQDAVVFPVQAYECSAILPLPLAWDGLVLKLRLDSFPFSYTLTITFIKKQNVILKFVSRSKYSNLRFPL